MRLPQAKIFLRLLHQLCVCITKIFTIIITPAFGTIWAFTKSLTKQKNQKPHKLVSDFFIKALFNFVILRIIFSPLFIKIFVIILVVKQDVLELF